MPLNQAFDALVEALEDLVQIEGFRVGLQRTIAANETWIASGLAEAQEALQLRPVWRALDDLAAAVQQRRQ